MAKPSYAAVAAAEPTPNPKAQSSADATGTSQGDAPPPYSGPSQPHQHHHQLSTQPPLPPTHLEAQPVLDPHGWSAPVNLQVAQSRARRRFWGAFFWAWVIYIALGLILGGGISDVRHAPVGRHGHWDKHGDWHNDDRVIADWVGSLLGAEESQMVER